MHYACVKGRCANINIQVNGYMSHHMPKQVISLFSSHVTLGSNVLTDVDYPPLTFLFLSLSLSLSSAEPLPLMDLCRRAARLALGRERLQEIESLPLPQSLKNYLQYQ